MVFVLLLCRWQSAASFLANRLAYSDTNQSKIEFLLKQKWKPLSLQACKLIARFCLFESQYDACLWFILLPIKTEYFVVYNELFYNCLLYWDDVCKRFQVSIKSQAFIRTEFQIEKEFYFKLKLCRSALFQNMFLSLSYSWNLSLLSPFALLLSSFLFLFKLPWFGSSCLFSLKFTFV